MADRKIKGGTLGNERARRQLDDIMGGLANSGGRKTTKKKVATKKRR